MEHFHGPAWAGCLDLLPPSSYTPAPQLNVGDWKEVLDFIPTTENISVINSLFLLNPKHSSCWEEH